MTLKILYLTLCLALFAMEAHAYKKYVAYQVSYPFFTAWQTCRLMGGHLASIESSEENNRVETAIRAVRNLSKVWFIGGTDIGIEGRFIWIGINKEIASPNYINWRAGEPNNKNGKENCLSVGGDGSIKWNDVPCDTKADGFVCAFVS